MRPLDSSSVPLDGLRLIEASAGTGKTFTLTMIYLRLLIEEGLRPEQILVVTYTRAATAELRERVRRRIVDALDLLEGRSKLDREDPLRRYLADRRATAGLDAKTLKGALAAFDLAAISTIHGFAQGALADHALETGEPFAVDVVSDERPFVDEIAADLWTSRYHAMDVERVRAASASLKYEDLRRIAREAAKHASARFVPAEPRESAVEAALVPARRSRDAALELWFEERQLIVGMLTGGALKKNIAKPETVRERWAPWFDASPPPHGPSTVDWFKKWLSPAGMVSLTKKGFDPPSHAFFAACESWLGDAEALQAEARCEAVWMQRRAIDLTRQELPAKLDEAGVRTFNALLLRLAQAVDEGHVVEALRERYRAVLVDEFQDTDPLQYSIFARVFGSASTFLIGDPKQAIYAFRGADLFAYLEAARDAGEEVYSLQTNFRSDPRLVAAVNTIFDRDRSFVFEDLAFLPVASRPGSTDSFAGSPMRFVVSEDGESGKVADRDFVDLTARIAFGLLTGGERLGDRPIEPGDLAILARSNAFALDVQNALRALGIPSVFRGDKSVFESESAGALSTLLSAVLEPSDSRAMRAALTSTLWGFNGDDLHRLDEDESETSLHLQRFGRAHELWHGRGIFVALRFLLDAYAIEQRCLARGNGERTLTDLYHLLELLHRREHEHHLGPRTLASWFARARVDEAQRDEQAAESEQMRLETDDSSVKLFTVHTSKGLEFPFVICPQLNTGFGRPRKSPVTYHDPDSGELTVDFSADVDPEHLEAAEREWLAENVRLTYVALTRAKHRCYIPWGQGKNFDCSALAALVHGAIDAANPLEALKKRCKSLDHASIQADLNTLSSTSDGAIGVESSSDYPSPDRAYERPQISRGETRLRRFEGSVPSGRGTTSFSAWVAASHAALYEARDLDEKASGQGDVEELAELELAAMPAGTTTGLLVHRVLEDVDFADAATATASIDRAVRAEGTRGEEFRPFLERIVEVVSHAKLPAGQPFSLAETDRRQRRVELEFVLAHASPSPLVLAECLRRHESWYSSYASKLEGLSAEHISGYLRGFIDLVVTHEGRSYVLDYKTNALGSHRSDYSEAALRAAMIHHDYVLQALLYSVAIHRYLGLNLADYAPEKHHGGALYLFVRGMTDGAGVCSLVPSPELLLDLDQCLGGLG